MIPEGLSLDGDTCSGLARLLSVGVALAGGLFKETIASHIPPIAWFSGRVNPSLISAHAHVASPAGKQAAPVWCLSSPLPVGSEAQLVSAEAQKFTVLPIRALPAVSWR